MLLYTFMLENMDGGSQYVRLAVGIVNSIAEGFL